MDRADLLHLWKQVFGDFNGFWEAFFCWAYEDGHCLYLQENGQLQAALYWFACGSWVYIFAVATAPDCRGRGLCRRLMEKAHGYLQTLGYDGALLVPADAGLRQMYAKMGYREGPGLDVLSLEAGERAAALTWLSPEEYHTVRPSFLPVGGLAQGAEVFSLMAQTGVRFYRGPGCILAAEGGNVLEYLGDKTQMPGVLAALGCREGTFRTPGENTPFAMVHPFREDAPRPTYFAFAFD